MRKNLLLVLFLLSSSVGVAQVKLGFQFSPTLSTNRIDESSDSLAYNTHGIGLRFIAGPIVDFPITENYHFSTGLMIASKRAAFKADDGTNEITERYGLQYLQIPVTMKLFTNEVALDKKLYLQLGAIMEVNLKEKEKEEHYYIVENFKFFDTALMVGLGMEYKMGVNTIVFGGLSYRRGLLNTISEQVRSADELNLKNDCLSLDLGVKF